MPVSTDGVMLGAWANCPSQSKILDIGTGTGLLALMCAQRFPNAQITALDIEISAIEAAQKNFTQSPWSDRLCVRHTDVLQFESEQRFEHIICNPPYFNSGEQSKQSNVQRLGIQIPCNTPHYSNVVMSYLNKMVAPVLFCQLPRANSLLPWRSNKGGTYRVSVACNHHRKSPCTVYCLN